MFRQKVLLNIILINFHKNTTFVHCVWRHITAKQWVVIIASIRFWAKQTYQCRLVLCITFFVLKDLFWFLKNYHSKSVLYKNVCVSATLLEKCSILVCRLICSHLSCVGNVSSTMKKDTWNVIVELHTFHYIFFVLLCNL